MEMEHARMLKQSLQENITKLSIDFEIQTGLKITEIALHSFCAVGSKLKLRSVEVVTEFR